MILTCPSCNTRYTVEANRFPPEGRKVRCSKCGNQWMQYPADDAPKPVRELPPMPHFDAPEDESGEEAAALSALKRKTAVMAVLNRRVAVYAAWGALAVLIGAGGWFAYDYRVPIVRELPALAGVYGAVGIDVNIRGLEFRNVAYEQAFEGETPVLAISGEVANITGGPLRLPKVRVGLRDANLEELYSWTFDLAEDELGPAESVSFVTQLSSPPQEARDMEIRFLPEGTAPGHAPANAHESADPGHDG